MLRQIFAKPLKVAVELFIGDADDRAMDKMQALKKEHGLAAHRLPEYQKLEQTYIDENDKLLREMSSPKIKSF